MFNLRFHLLFVSMILCWSSRGFADCVDVTFTPPDQIALPGAELAIVTHPTSIWDPRASAKAGIDFMIRQAKTESRPIVILRHAQHSQTYYTQDCAPTHYAQSTDGEFSFRFAARHVTMTGGQFHQCFRETFLGVTKELARTNADAQIDIFAEGVYAVAQYLRGENFESYVRLSHLIGGSPSTEGAYLTLAQVLRALPTVEARLQLLEDFLRDSQISSTVDGAAWDRFQIKLVIDGRQTRMIEPDASKRTLLVNVTTDFPSPF